MLWEDLRCEQFEEAVKISKGVCVVPIGCLEKHGPHSPLGTDTIIATGIATKAAELEPVVVFPTMFFGDKSGAGEFPGTVIFSLETRWHIFRETCNEIHRNGFTKILFLNGHGGNADMLGAFTRAMMKENPDIMCFVKGTGGETSETIAEILADPEAYDYLTEEDRAAMQEYLDTKKHGGHACFSETARCLYFRPETMRLEGIADESGDSTHRFDAFKEHGIKTHFAWMGNYPNSYSSSNDYVINQRIAKAFTEHRIPKMAAAIRFLKEETISNEYFKEWRPKQK
jgi:creatinine amidohydrolase